MANRSLTKDVSDNIVAGAVIANFFLNKRDRLLENHTDHDKVTFKGSNEIPLKIGDNWFFCDTDVNISTATHMDTGSVANGKDYYVYACNNAGTLEFKISLNSTTPTGFTAANSRKIGGFHTLCADVGTISGHALSGYVANDILPTSIWDLKHRPICEPEGMVYDEGTGIWVDIYLASGTGASTASVYGATITDSRNWMDFVDDGHAVMKQLLTDEQFTSIATGAPEEAHVWNRSDPVTAGGHSAYFLLTLDVGPAVDWAAGDTITGGTSGVTCTVVECLTNTTYVCKNISDAAGFTDGEVLSNGAESADQGTGYPTWAAHAMGRNVSNIGCEDCVGAMHQWLLTPSARLDDGTAGGWYDLAGGKGSFYTYGNNKYGNTQLRAGGDWDDGAYCGSRCRDAFFYRWVADSHVGARLGAKPQ